MDDNYIKDLIIKYQNNEIELLEIEKYISLTIYRFPFFEFNIYDHDQQGEFYEYFYERLPKVLLKYQVKENVKFRTYFYLILRRYLLNFIKKNKSKLQISYQEDLTIYPDHSTGGEDFSFHRESDDTVKNLEQLLPRKDILFLKLFVPEILTKEDISYFSNELKLSFLETVRRTVILFEGVAEREGKNTNKVIVIVPVKAVAKFLKVEPQKVSKKLSSLKKKMSCFVGEIDELFR